MNKPFLIAEIGINANGSINDALKLIDMAKECEIDAVKFQKRTIDIVYSAEEQAKPRESKWGVTTGDQKRGLEFGRDEYDIIDRRCSLIGIDWFASAWDIPSLEFLEKYDLKHNKIASAMTTNIPFVTAVAKQGKHTFISAGMTTLEQLDKVVAIFDNEQCDFTLMHTVSIYPCDDNDCNLKVIPLLQERYRCDVGYSGHEKGILPSVLAVSLGATAIERHVTLDRTGYGSDQAASLERHGLELLVRDCKSVVGMLGDGEKRILPKELECAVKLRYWGDDVTAKCE